MVKPRIVLLIFVSGKVVLTGMLIMLCKYLLEKYVTHHFMYMLMILQILIAGAKVRQEIYEAFDNIYPILKSFKKQ